MCVATKAISSPRTALMGYKSVILIFIKSPFLARAKVSLLTNYHYRFSGSDFRKITDIYQQVDEACPLLRLSHWRAFQ
ncbi:hypothetical protein DXT89_03035 [Agrobacterium vitis]|uniref:Uncharacterized protein n=1 Tax=Agrobacterium vitis TaxID=373 RepID=A0A368NVA0_AGRVI|nr:hypothetical protein DXM22_00685 [Agrobacterium vitis]KAA3532329.1 hypothetical protein DXT89_03035 [Agrobacterium vitis]RCU53664.1 hypothetical protein ASB66_011180 [Agrobacterium vitis]